MTLGGFATGLLVESHEGHPTKIEGNPDHPMSLGATNIFHQASLLDLYDPNRSQAVLNGGQISSWETFLSALNNALQVQQTKRGAGLRILAETVTSPTLHAQIQAVLQKFPEARWHQFEPINRDNVHEGSRLAFGQIVETHYHFDKAKIIAAMIFCAHVAETHWIIAPSFFPGGIAVHWLDFATFFGIGGLWLAAFAAILKRAPLLPQNDPRLEFSTAAIANSIESQKNV